MCSAFCMTVLATDDGLVPANPNMDVLNSKGSDLQKLRQTIQSSFDNADKDHDGGLSRAEFLGFALNDNTRALIEVFFSIVGARSMRA